MCRSLSKSTLTTLGIITSIFYGVLSIICIVIAGVDYQQTDYRWAQEGEWRHLATLQITAVVLVFFFCFLGILLMLDTSKCKVMQLLFTCLELLATLFTFAVAIFALVAGAVSKSELTKSCQRDYTGIFEHFKYLDDFIHLADETLCSEKCPCFFSNYSAIEDFTDFYQAHSNEYSMGDNLHMIDNLENGAINFANCSLEAKSQAYGVFKYIDKTGNIDIKDFNEFWGRIEKKFKCNGWCEVNYESQIYHQGNKRKMIKYVFSDVNGGVVNNRGCMHRMVDWLPKVINTYGSVLLIISVIMVVNFIFIASLFCNCYTDEYNSVKAEKSSKSEHSQITNKLGESHAPMIKQNIELKDITPVIEDKNEERLDAEHQ